MNKFSNMDNKDKWIKNVLNSMSGSKRATPNWSLHDRIEESIYFSNKKIVPIQIWKRYAVAASLILALNVSTIYYSYQYTTASNPIVQADDQERLFTSYQIYE